MTEQKEKQKNSNEKSRTETSLGGCLLGFSVILFTIFLFQLASMNALKDENTRLKSAYDNSIRVLSKATIWLDYDQNIGVYYKEDFMEGHMTLFHRHQSPVDENYEKISVYTDDLVNYRPERRYHKTCQGDVCTQTLVEHTELQNCAIIQDIELRWDAVCDLILYSQ